MAQDNSLNHNKRPIEKYFPVHEVNKIADKESSGIAKRYYRPIYTIHKWWARRLGSVFRTITLYTLAEKGLKVLGNKDELFNNKTWDGDPKSLWDFYLEDVDFSGKTILDPFFGGGTSIVEALKMNSRVVGGELNPVAWFVTKKEVDPVDLDALNQEFQKIREHLSEQIKKFYKTTCPHCNKDAGVKFYFWIKILPCLNCSYDVPLFKGYRIAKIRPQKILQDDLGGAKSGYWVFCPRCNNIFPVENYHKESVCPDCKLRFLSERGNASGQYYTCPECGQKDKIIEAIKRMGKPEAKLYALEYYCDHCDNEDNPSLMNGKGYKPVGEKDLQLFQKAKDEFQEIEDQLLIPSQEVPKGLKTRELTNHGYQKFRDMFNERQLLLLGKLLDQILTIEDLNTREYLLLAFSETIKFNNVFCRYNRSKNQLSDIFRGHAYHPQNSFLESDIWGSYSGVGFKNNVEKLIFAKKYTLEPFDRYITNGKSKKKYFDIKPIANHAEKFNDLNDNKGTLLFCGDSSYLPIPDNSIDAVITDPPYFDNLMYSELSDFFYVWLRKGLINHYEYFSSKFTPKNAEVIKNPAQNKGEEEFTEGLTRVFSESHQKLKDDGLMVFTFHHAETEAWASVLTSVLEAGFYITAVYPIQAEMATSTHIRDKGNIEYDMIIVCRKRGGISEKQSWGKVYDRIYFKAQDAIKELEAESERLAQGDMFVITMGKCLEEYSKHYPEVYVDGKRLSVQDALDDIRAIVDSHFMEGRFDEYQNKLDTPSAAFLTFLATGSDEVSYTSLNKRLQQRAISIEDFLKWGMAKQEGSKIIKLDLEDRAEIIEQKKSQNVSAIDRAHYIQYLKEIKDDPAAIKNWATDDAVVALDELSKLQKSKELRVLKEFIEQKEYTKSQAKQEKLL